MVGGFCRDYFLSKKTNIFIICTLNVDDWLGSFTTGIFSTFVSDRTHLISFVWFVLFFMGINAYLKL